MPTFDLHSPPAQTTDTLSRPGQMEGLKQPKWLTVDRILRRTFANIDLPLLGGLLALITCGLFVLASADNFGEEFYKQIKWLCVGMFCLLVIAQIPPEWLRRWAAPLFIASLIVLALVPFIGVKINGSQRWLDLAGMRLQPAEMVKITAAIALAAWFHYRANPPSAVTVIGGFLILAVPFSLVIIQPDLGTSLLILAIGIFIVFLAGLPPWLVASIAISLILLVTTIVLLAYHEILTLAAVKQLLVHDLGLLQSYQFTRIETTFNPQLDPKGAGYQIIQSRIAIGSGGLFGKGWMNGTQTQLEFLPFKTTDFIFPVLAEEFGLFGALPVFALYLFLVFRGLYIAAVAQHIFGRVLAGTLALSFFSHVFVNIGMVSGILPVVGVPLPLMSYGGTSLVTILAGFGILMSIHGHRRRLQED